jgi:cysteine-rich repeat protein
VGECTGGSGAQCLTSADCPAAPAGQTCCGNGIVDPGETCDDGNTADEDACPPTCVNSCTRVPGSSFKASVAYTGPAGTNIAGLGIFVHYPPTKVNIASPDTDVTAAFGVSSSVSDHGYGFGDEAAKSSGPLPSPFLHMTFQKCVDAADPTPSDFTCEVKDASDDQGNVVPASQVTCTVTVP